MKVENDFFPEIAGELGNNLAQVKHHQKRLEDFKPNIAVSETFLWFCFWQSDSMQIMSSAER
jgi:hypothetical protein